MKILNMWKDERGAVLPLFGLSLFTLLIATGMAVDYGRSQMVHSKLHAALDAAGLAAGAVVRSHDATIEARKFMDANFPAGYMGSTITSFSAVASGLEPGSTSVTVDVSATAEVNTVLMNLFGHDKMSVSAEAQIVQTRTRGFELVMVLDNSGSMGIVQDGTSRMNAMKKAVNNFLETLYGAANSYDNLFIGLVPFSNQVRVGSAKAVASQWRRESPFTDVPISGAVECIYPTPKGFNWAPDPVYKAGARSRFAFWDTKETPPVSGFLPSALILNVDEWLNAYYDANPPPAKWHPPTPPKPPGKEKCSTNKETGKVTCSKGGSKGSPGGWKKPGKEKCSGPKMTPLIKEKSTLKTTVNGMSPDGQTRIDLGTVWGWYMLSPQWRGFWNHAKADLPLDYGTKDMDKVAILLTDGVNCCGASEVATANANLAQVCTNMKAQGILVYSITFHEDDPATQALMRNCATEPSAPYYTHAEGNDDINDVFQQIADSLMDLRISQ